MTITQTVEIPANRQLHLDLNIPNEVPIGKTNVVIQVPVRDTSAPKEKLFKSKKELDEFLKNAKTPISDSLTGILAHLGDITIDQIREERLAKHLK
jgi:hypothetical protein